MSDDMWGKCIARTFNESGVDGWWVPQSEVNNLQSQLAEANRKLEISVKALKELVDKIGIIHDSIEYMGVWHCAQIHLGVYKGPQYAEELKRAREALKELVDKI